jgi:predicted NAD-dependent protein-ADP-ribosyltransferase YbiA (DUF1768 family)
MFEQSPRIPSVVPVKNSPGSPYFELSNHAPFQIRVRNHVYPTSEHFFQSQKFQEEGAATDYCANASPTVQDALSVGRDRNGLFSIRPD